MSGMEATVLSPSLCSRPSQSGKTSHMGLLEV
uniref:Family with sequence similarity 54 member B isoform 2 n=1 Tax=Homo sapiens TaxID=9606 RepID=A0A0S2Z5H4_HUMAN|nr:family with sequence similarity 54 member B isoform 2 [Homo sapiens]